MENNRKKLKFQNFRRTRNERPVYPARKIWPRSFYLGRFLARENLTAFTLFFTKRKIWSILACFYWDNIWLIENHSFLPEGGLDSTSIALVVP